MLLAILHAFAFGEIIKSGEIDMQDNPISCICVGSLGSSGPGFPTIFRGVGAEIPTDLDVNEPFTPLEKNGFTIIDVTPEKNGDQNVCLDPTGTGRCDKHSRTFFY